MAVSSARIAFLVLTGLAIAPLAHAQQCDIDRLTVNYGKSKADLQGYICNVNGDGGKLRISFYRVSETVAGALVMGDPIPAVDRIFGGFSFVQNSVLREIKTLFTSYGASRIYDSDETIALAIGAKWPPPSAPGSDPGSFWTVVPMSDDKKANKPVKTWRISNAPYVKSDGVLLKLPSEVTLNTDHWPSDYNMFYDCLKKEKLKLISCTTIWKYLEASDFDAIVRDVRVAAQRAEKGALQDKAAIRTGISAIERTFALFNYLNKGKLPTDFASISSSMGTSADGCGASNWGFSYTDRPLTLDFAVIENLGEQTVNIRDLIGANNPVEDFRAIADPPTFGGGKSGPLGLGPNALPPSARIAVALRISFRNPADPGVSRQDMTQENIPDELKHETAEETFKKIQAKPANFLFKEVIGGFNNPKQATKVRESFLKPTMPNVSEYAYGPEMLLAGLEIEGKTHTLDGNTSGVVMIQGDFQGDGELDLDINKIRVKPGKDDDGSCPILYSWDDASQQWIYHGKVLHLAEGAARTMAERVPLRALRTRFRIAEEEPEVSFIDKVRLHVTLDDGSHFLIAPRQDRKMVITENTAVDVEFVLPSDVKPEAVAKTEIEIGGYYRRYSDILAAETTDAGAEKQPVHLVK
jgi:hypothetical protein